MAEVNSDSVENYLTELGDKLLNHCIDEGFNGEDSSIHDAIRLAYSKGRVAGEAAAEQRGLELGRREGWVAVTERLPANETTSLVFGFYEGKHGSWAWQAVCNFEADHGLWRGIPSDCASDEVTHWMPLPSPPVATEGGER